MQEDIKKNAAAISNYIDKITNNKETLLKLITNEKRSLKSKRKYM